ncbi:MAG TPA: T9SS type A sorting domain-containing protein, partial [Hymenobacter sp.]
MAVPYFLQAPAMRNAEVLVSDTRGVLLQTLRLGNTDHQQLDVHKLPAGIYLLRFSTPQQTLVQRVEI